MKIPFQVLISEAGGGRKDRKNEGHNLERSNDDELNNTSESHVEMDSRLLSALLTVSINSLLLSSYNIFVI